MAEAPVKKVSTGFQLMSTKPFLLSLAPFYWLLFQTFAMYLLSHEAESLVPLSLSFPLFALFPTYLCIFSHIYM